jgi:predicted AlkP superfamily pyrophosphatase or phosphodiesterase
MFDRYFPVPPRLLVLAILWALLLPGQATAQVAETRLPVTILVSIDGFRPDYLRRGNSPWLDALAAGGVSAVMRPSFPTKTFPNHWTIVTGDRPDRHGIVANRMEDPARPGEIFTMASRDPFWWNAVPPIWVEAERAGIPTAIMFWPGSEVAWGGRRTNGRSPGVTGGTRPGEWRHFSESVTETQRVNRVIGWLRRPAARRPHFVALYFDAVDTAGHHYGPDDPRTAAAVARVDRAIGLLVDRLRALGQPANILIVADHGMAPTSPDRVISLDRIAAPTDYRIVEHGPYAALVPRPGREAALAAALLRPHPHMQCWRKGALPARFHYGTNPRVPPFICLAGIGWLIEPSQTDDIHAGGAHGYDNAAPEMAALFIANGPAFLSGVSLPTFDNVDVYPLLARLVGVTPHSSDGNPATLTAALRRPD